MIPPSPTRCRTAALYVLAFLHGGGWVAAEGLPDALEDQHPWAGFGVGSWKQVRLVTETLDADGRVQGATVTDTKTTLAGIDDKGYTLRVEVTVEVGGKRFPSSPIRVRQGFAGESDGQTIRTAEAGASTVSLAGQEIATAIHEVAVEGNGNRQLWRIYFSEQQPPHVLKREILGLGPDGKSVTHRTTTEVVATGIPCKVLNAVKPATHLKTTHKQADGHVTTTLEIHCDDIPGRVVSHTSQLANDAGAVIQRSTLELVAYGANVATDNRLPRRRHSLRNRMR